MGLDLNRPWIELPWAVTDFETTGVDNTTCMPVSVACVRFELGKVREAYTTLLNPGIPIPEEASAIHGVTDEMVAGAPQLVDVAHELARVAGSALPVAYNAVYDRPIMHRFVTGTDCPLFDPAVEWLCPLVIVREVDRYVKGQGRHKLETTCSRYGVKLEGAHNALADCTAAGQLLWQLYERKKVKPSSARVLLQHIAKMRVEQDANFASFKARMERQNPRAGGGEA